MSQTVGARPPRPTTATPGTARTAGAAVAVPAAVAVRAPGPLDALRAGLEGTPGKLRGAAALAVLACLVFALLGGSAFQAWGGALDDARSDAAQLVRVQGIQNSLLRADAAASNAYLSGGIEPPAQRAAYTAALADASKGVAEAAAATPADAAQLVVVNDALARYAGLIEQARANNRQGLLLGAAYLRQAGTVLRSEIVPALEKVSAENRQRVVDAYGAGNAATTRLVVAGIVVLVGLVLVQLWLARRTHRILNAPLAAATVGVLAALVAGAFALSSTANKATDVAARSYAATVGLSQARTAAFDAKAQESLGLIARGNAAAAEALYAKATAVAAAQLKAAAEAGAPTAPADDLTRWTEVHTAIRALDDGGKWDKATLRAVGSGADASNTLFAAFDASSSAALTAQESAVKSGLSGSRGLLLVLGWLTLALGIVAAGAAWLGVSQRLGEYR